MLKAWRNFPHFQILFRWNMGNVKIPPFLRYVTNCSTLLLYLFEWLQVQVRKLEIFFFYKIFIYKQWNAARNEIYFWFIFIYNLCMRIMYDGKWKAPSTIKLNGNDWNSLVRASVSLNLLQKFHSSPLTSNLNFIKVNIFTSKSFRHKKDWWNRYLPFDIKKLNEIEHMPEFILQYKVSVPLWNFKATINNYVYDNNRTCHLETCRLWCVESLEC